MDLSPNTTTEQLIVSFFSIISAPEQYCSADQNTYCYVSVIVFSTFWSYVIVMILSCCYHWKNVFDIVRAERENENRSRDSKSVVLNHHEPGLAPIWVSTSHKSVGKKYNSTE